MLRPLEVYEEMLRDYIKNYHLQMEMGNSQNARWIYDCTICPTMVLYKQALWAEYCNDKNGIFYFYGRSGKAVSVYIQMDRALI